MIRPKPLSSVWREWALVIVIGTLACAVSPVIILVFCLWKIVGFFLPASSWTVVEDDL